MLTENAGFGFRASPSAQNTNIWQTLSRPPKAGARQPKPEARSSMHDPATLGTMMFVGSLGKEFSWPTNIRRAF